MPVAAAAVAAAAAAAPACRELWTTPAFYTALLSEINIR